MKKLYILLFVFVLALSSFATEATAGNDKAGSTMMGDFLKLNWDPASYALADAYSGYSDNFAGSIFINPAGLARLLNSQFTLTSLYAPYTTFKYYFAGAEQNFGIQASMAIGGVYLDWGEEHETDSTGYITDTFRNKNTLAFVSFGSALGGGLYLGFTGKFIDQTLYNTYQKTFLGDVGIQFIPQAFNKIGIGLSVTNIGLAKAMDYNSTNLKAPTTFHLGWVLKAIDAYGSGLSFAFDNTFPVDGAYKLNLGAELNMGNTIILRAGYKVLGWDIPEFTSGIGIVFSNSLKLDVAYSKKGNLGPYELASVSMIFGQKKKKDWEKDIKELNEKLDKLSEKIDTNADMITENSEYINTNVETINSISGELKDLKDILAKSSAELRKALEETKKKNAETLAKKEAEQEAMKQKMAEEQKKAVEEAAAKAAKEAADKLRKEYEAKMNKIKEEVSKDKHIELKQDKRGIVLNLQGINFASGKADIPAYAYPTLDRVAKVLGEYPDAKIRVEGHTDSLGSASYNQSLSESRARAVMLYLIKTHGISPDKINAIGYGESKPIDSNGTPEGRARNRRVEIVIIGTTLETKVAPKKPAPKTETKDVQTQMGLKPGNLKVYVGSYTKEDEAISEVHKLQNLNYSVGYVKVRLKNPDGTSQIIFRVKMGEYDKASADKLIVDLKAKGFDAWSRK